MKSAGHLVSNLEMSVLFIWDSTILIYTKISIVFGTDIKFELKMWVFYAM